MNENKRVADFEAIYYISTRKTTDREAMSNLLYKQPLAFITLMCHKVLSTSMTTHVTITGRRLRIWSLLNMQILQGRYQDKDTNKLIAIYKFIIRCKKSKNKYIAVDRNMLSQFLIKTILIMFLHERNFLHYIVSYFWKIIK